MSIQKSISSALKQNLLPGLILQCFALALLATYFFIPAANPIFSYFSDLKHEFGYAYSGFATALFGGVIPFIVIWFRNRHSQTHASLSVFVFYIGFWVYRGIEVDFFYRMQAVWFGSDHQLNTLLKKVAVDQIIYSPFWAAPSIATAYLWRECNFNFTELKRSLNKEFLRVKLPTLIVSSWVVWTPAVSIIYAMPNELQIPIQNLVLCFWALMLAVLNKK